MAHRPHRRILPRNIDRRNLPLLAALMNTEPKTKKEKRELGRAYFFLILVFISAVFSIASVSYSQRRSDIDDRKFCDVVSGITAEPVKKPADPKADPSRERAHVWYVKF